MDQVIYTMILSTSDKHDLSKMTARYAARELRPAQLSENYAEQKCGQIFLEVVAVELQTHPSKIYGNQLKRSSHPSA